MPSACCCARRSALESGVKRRLFRVALALARQAELIFCKCLSGNRFSEYVEID